MAFGSGVLVAALAFSLIEEAFELSESIISVIIGFVLGGLSYTTANNIKKSHGENAGGGKGASGLALLVGIATMVGFAIAFIVGRLGGG